MLLRPTGYKIKLQNIKHKKKVFGQVEPLSQIFKSDESTDVETTDAQDKIDRFILPQNYRRWNTLAIPREDVHLVHCDIVTPNGHIYLA